MNNKTFNKFTKPDGRYNEWGERKILKASNEKVHAVSQELSKLNMGYRAKSLYWSAKITDSTGLEFVFVSNFQFPILINSENHIQIVPCFTPLNPMTLETDDRQTAMMKWGQFIYDGWVPKKELTTKFTNQIVSELDSLVSIFSIVGNYFAYWEPKYFYSTQPVESQIATQHDFMALSSSIRVMEKIPETDRKAIDRSMAWLSNALRLGSVQRFLFLFLSIESLATYIESSKTPKNSQLKISFGPKTILKKEQKLQRDNCIENIFKKGQFTATKVQKAYQDCINRSIRDKLIEHLDRVFKNSDASNLIFVEETDGKTLWQLRNDIAHGSLNLLSDKEIFFISRKVNDLEIISRNYFRKIFTVLANNNYFTKPRQPILSIPFSQAIGGPDTEFTCTNMADYYANVDSYSNSFMRVRF